jgi:hypothetical protein
LARVNYHFEKRRKELAKKKKNEEKRERKLAKKNPQTGEILESSPGPDTLQQDPSDPLLTPPENVENTSVSQEGVVE